MKIDPKFLLEMYPIIRKRNKNILSKLSENLLSEVSDNTLRLILKTVPEYWTDSLRPALTSFCCEAVGGEEKIANDAGLMFSMMSAGLSNHDDIIDKSNKKHSRDTILGQHGLEKALLVGDLILLKGWKMLPEICERVSKPKKVMDLMEKYIVEMCEAQIIEVSYKHNFDVGVEEYENLLLKLNADLKVCAKIGSMVGGGSDDKVQALGNYGEKLGYLMALRDDLEDFQDESSFFHRLKYESIPLPLLYAIKSTDDGKPKNKLIDTSYLMNSPDFVMVKNFCKDTNAFDYVHNKSKVIAEQANEELKIIDPSNAKKVLESLIQLILRDVQLMVLKLKA
ncbi:MAG: hypothetical protein AC479_04335 [miscellaneous Crenarchaeota group-6 archaeon AD8-1]|nr:MAG: hypothetical protein AC479_04335 [miscellaneous Crenarchaeota group-6 archaeon AD8-1]